uniref:hypothetical protein n=1 Tax=Cronobacter sakazakii TaxID=28141 RepID=UPI00294B4809
HKIGFKLILEANMDTFLLIVLVIKFLMANVVPFVLVCMASSLLLAMLAVVLHLMKGIIK